MSLQRKSKWVQKKRPIVYKFEEQAEEIRKQNAIYWDQLALPKIKPVQRKEKLVKQKPKKPKKEKKPAQLLLSAYKETDLRDKGQCQFPGCYRYSGANHHHIIFRSHGGRNHIANLVTLCLEHHTLGKESPHQSQAWRRYWEGWAEEKYPLYWQEIREGQKITAIGG